MSLLKYVFGVECLEIAASVSSVLSVCGACRYIIGGS